MKRKIILLMVIITIFSFAGCQKGDVNESETTPSTDETVTQPNDGTTDTPDVSDEASKSQLYSVIEQIYQTKNPSLTLSNITVDLNDNDSVKYYTGLNDASKIKDIAVSESAIGSQAYSLVLVQVNNVEDVNSVAEEMLNGIDQRKWVCVEADDLKVVAQGDTIMLFMVSSELKDTVTSQEMVAAFKQARSGELDIELKK